MKRKEAIELMMSGQTLIKKDDGSKIWFDENEDIFLNQVGESLYRPNIHQINFEEYSPGIEIDDSAGGDDSEGTIKYADGIRMLVDGVKLIQNGVFIYAFNSQRGFVHKNGPNDTKWKRLQINDIRFNRCKIYNELHNLNAALDHMDQGGQVKLVVEPHLTFCSKGDVFALSERGVYSCDGAALRVTKVLRGKVWELL